MNPRDIRRAAVAFVACFAFGACLTAVFLLGERRVDSWCSAHPTLARTSSTCSYSPTSEATP